MKNKEIKNIVDECCDSMNKIDLEFYSEEMSQLSELYQSVMRRFYDKENFDDSESKNKLENLLYRYTKMISDFRNELEVEEAKMKNLLIKYQQLKTQE